MQGESNKFFTNSFIMLFFILNSLEFTMEAFSLLTDEEIVNLLEDIQTVKNNDDRVFDCYDYIIFDALKILDNVSNNDIKERILMLIKNLYHYIFDNCNNKDGIDYFYKRINYFQVIKRFREYDSGEIEELKTIYNNCGDDINAKIGIDILLGDKKDFDVLYSELNDDMKDIIATWPILNLI